MVRDVYARLLKRGIPMSEIDRMDIMRYFDVLARETGRDSGEPKRGTIDDILG